MTITRNRREPNQSRGRTSASWPWNALIWLITIGALVAGVLAERTAPMGEHSETDLMTHCLAIANAANPTVPQHIASYLPVVSFGLASPRHMPGAIRFNACTVVTGR